ncbi:hypothetical protein KUTeg_019060, partial [Tegillarca granosa]
MHKYSITGLTDWSKNFPEANGQHQSPINLISDNAEYDPTLSERPLLINYSTSRETDILNDGQTVIVYPKYRGVVSGGPLVDGHQYELAEIRFHWGRLSTKGSEHKCNGKAFPMENYFKKNPELRDYWVYNGSMTYPPCYENVTWILFRYPLMLSSEQVDDFRHLKTYAKGDKPPVGHDGKLVDNFRPVQPLNDRI